MTGELTREILAELAEPFAADAVRWKPQSTSRDKTRALAVAYIDARAVMDRLDAVVAGDWGDRMTVIDNGHVLCDLTVCGVTRSDVGEMGEGEFADPLKAACSDALKRAAVHFGVARYLYALPAVWVDYDERRKQLVQIPEIPVWARPGGNGHVPETSAQVRAERKDAPPATPPRRKVPADAPRMDRVARYADMDDQVDDEPPPGVIPHEVEEARDDAVAEIVAKVKRIAAQKLGTRDPRPASENQIKAVRGLLLDLTGGDEGQGHDDRHGLLTTLFGRVEYEGLRMHEASAIIDWLKVDDGWEIKPDARVEALAVIEDARGTTQQAGIPFAEMTTGDKVMALVARCWKAYLGTDASLDDQVAVAADVFPNGYDSVDDIPFAIVTEFDQTLADMLADQSGANLPPAAQVVGAITEMAGRAGQHTTEKALQARAAAVRRYVNSLVEEPDSVPF